VAPPAHKIAAPNSATPSYPDILRQAGVEGEALVSFVVDTTGRVDTLLSDLTLAPSTTLVTLP
jgi:outer membrane biosynthesis protein TonB